MKEIIRFKIFSGCFSTAMCKAGPADKQANEWLKKHPDVEIIEMKYQQARMGDHSICIMYRVKSWIEEEGDEDDN